MDGRFWDFRGQSRKQLLSLFALVLHSSLTVATMVDGWYYQNIAVGKPSRHIDTYKTSGPHWANDGNPSGHASFCSVTQTGIDTWWVVDLMESSLIYAVQMKNRNGFTHAKLRDFYVYVSEANPLPLPPVEGNNFTGEICLFHSGYLSVNGLRFLPCENGKVLKGRYVYVWKPGSTGQLYLCELEALTRYPLRDFKFSLTEGRQSEEEPYISEVLPEPSYLQCSIFCLNLVNATVETMQFNNITGVCSCFEVKPFDDSNLLENTTSRHGSIIMRRQLLL